MAPADDADLPPLPACRLRHQRAAAIPLTGIAAALRHPGAKIALVDDACLERRVLALAFADVDERKGRLPQVRGNRRGLTGFCVSPSTKYGFPCLSFFLTTQRVKPHPVTVASRLSQFGGSLVVAPGGSPPSAAKPAPRWRCRSPGSGRITFVDDDAPHGARGGSGERRRDPSCRYGLRRPSLPGGRPALRRSSARPSGRDGRDERAAAGEEKLAVGSAQIERDLPWPLLLGRALAAHDAGRARVPRRPAAERGPARPPRPRRRAQRSA